MKSLSALMLIGMLFAISAVNANWGYSRVAEKCQETYAGHCKKNTICDDPKDPGYCDVTDDSDLAIPSCMCTIWTLIGKGDCYKGCMADRFDPRIVPNIPAAASWTSHSSPQDERYYVSSAYPAEAFLQSFHFGQVHTASSSRAENTPSHHERNFSRPEELPPQAPLFSTSQSFFSPLALPKPRPVPSLHGQAS
ncbi:hypothetical protein CF328_g8841 [Tilletia controversa]|nr:hypothetical protein CF328_g8841 [Tilletia controversa]